jgi:transcriptional regulator with XRE-family HTH domain
MNDLGPVLRRAREAAKITQQQVADHLGKTRPYVSRVESGINTTTDALFAWAEFLGLRVRMEPAHISYLTEEAASSLHLNEPPAAPYGVGVRSADALLISLFIRALPKLTPRERSRIEAELRMVLDEK